MRTGSIRRVLGVFVAALVVVLFGACVFLLKTYPANSVFNDTSDRIAVCEWATLRGGNMKPVTPGKRLAVYGTSCAVSFRRGGYAGCLLLPKANRVTVRVSSADSGIPSSLCGPGYAPHLKDYSTLAN